MTRELVTVVLTGIVVGMVVACGDDSSSGASSTGTAEAASGSTGGVGAGGGGCTGAGSTSVADCPSVCQALVAAACPGGPTQQDCESECGQLNDYVAMCPAWGGVVDCMGASPTFTCMSGEVVPAGCEVEFYCMSQCFD